MTSPYGWNKRGGDVARGHAVCAGTHGFLMATLVGVGHMPDPICECYQAVTVRERSPATRSTKQRQKYLSYVKIRVTHSQEEIVLNRAVLALEDGSVFEGRSFGAPAERSGEVVFNTAMTGYQEIFTDPSYAGQIVILTNPQIGNYGINVEDNEALKPFIEGLVVREFSAIASNWRSDQLARTYLEKNSIPVVSEIDTRALVRHLRTRGVMRGVLSAKETDPQALIAKARSIPS